MSALVTLICFPFQRERKQKNLSLFRKGVIIKIVMRTDLLMEKNITHIYTHKTGLYQLLK